jgi:hypothetical protein
MQIRRGEIRRAVRHASRPAAGLPARAGQPGPASARPGQLRRVEPDGSPGQPATRPPLSSPQ